MINNKQKEYRALGIIGWHEIDLKEQMRPSAFMNIIQELANNHASKLKFGYNELIKMDQVWVLSRLKIKFKKYPKWGDKYNIFTWHKGKHGLFGLRDFALFINNDSKNKTSVSKNNIDSADIVATSSWVIINTQTRRIERNNVFNISKEVQSMAKYLNAIGEPCDKLYIPDNLTYSGTHKILYSDIDFNMHTNNAKYLEWIMDDISIEFQKEHELCEIQINYITESKAGEEIELYNSINSSNINTDNTYIPNIEMFYEGRFNDKVIFQAKLLWK